MKVDKMLDHLYAEKQTIQPDTVCKFEFCSRIKRPWKSDHEKLKQRDPADAWYGPRPD